jgi:hypothetical protein
MVNRITNKTDPLTLILNVFNGDLAFVGLILNRRTAAFPNMNLEK